MVDDAGINMMTMPLKLSHVRLLVTDYAAAFAFYSQVLELPPRFSDAQGGYGEFGTGTVTLALFAKARMAEALGQGATPAPTATNAKAAVVVQAAEPVVEAGPVLVFAVDDVDAAYAELQRKGVMFVLPPTDRPEWTVRTAHLRDPDGHLIEINSPFRRRWAPVTVS